MIAATAPAAGLRPTPRPALLLAVLLVLAGGCTSLRPSNHRDWEPNVAVLPHARFLGNDKITVYNIRNTEYRTEDDYLVRHYDKTFDLARLEKVNFIVVPFPESPELAHTFLSFGFEEDEWLAVSVELRPEKGEKYHALQAMFNKYEITYVVGDERDLIGLRTNVRMNDVYVYPIRCTKAQARAAFRDIMDRINELHEKPEFYNTLTNNCTTNILAHVNHVATRPVPYNWKILFPGYADQLAYERGLIDTELSFEETRERARVNEKAYVYRDSPDFSRQIRR